MSGSENFIRSENSTILTPGAPGLTALLQCLAEDASIHAKHCCTAPIQPKQDSQQLLYCQSSGSTGQAKTIRRTPQSWIKSFAINARTFQISATDTYAVLGNPGHSLVLFALLEALHIGADLAALGGQSPKTQAQNLARFDVTVLYATPTQLRLLLAAARTAQIDALPHIRLLFSGGGKLGDLLHHALRAFFPNAAIHEFYGASETSFITISDQVTPAGSVGPAYPGVDIQLRPLPGEADIGEIWVTSPYMFDGYHSGQSDDTTWDGAYLSIGEIGHLDSDGYLFLKGRKSRMVTVADQNVFPEQIERVLLRHPDVRACAAITQPDAKRGHTITAVLQADEAPDLIAELRKTCRAALGAASVPRRFVIMPELPLLAAGKPDLCALETMIAGAT